MARQARLKTSMWAGKHGPNELTLSDHRQYAVL